MNKVMEREQAQAEVDAYIEKQCFLPSRLDAIKEQIDTAVEAMEYGFLSINEKGCMVQKLIKPFGHDNAINTLEYKDRLDLDDAAMKMKSMRRNDFTANVIATIATVTNQPTVIISKLGSEDMRIAQSLCAFF